VRGDATYRARASKLAGVRYTVAGGVRWDVDARRWAAAKVDVYFWVVIRVSSA
jgi:hypothetical protein